MARECLRESVANQRRQRQVRQYNERDGGGEAPPNESNQESEAKASASTGFLRRAQGRNYSVKRGADPNTG